jgi:voltage-gated potassium channel
MTRSRPRVIERGSAVYQLVLLALSVYVLVALVIESLFVQDPETRRVIQLVDSAICLVFLADFFVNLYLAESKTGYLKWGWIDFVSSVPAIDPLRWGRLSRMIRILRLLRTIKSARVLFRTIERSRFETLTLTVFLVAFVAFSVGTCLILEFEREYDSTISTAQGALSWAVLNVLNAKVSIDQAKSPGGIITTVVLNKLGLLLFAYLNAMIIAWLIGQRRMTQQTDESTKVSDRLLVAKSSELE